MAELAINNYDSAITEISSFFLFYKYNVKLLQLLDKDLRLVQNKRSFI
jgi:hypothetical protein